MCGRGGRLGTMHPFGEQTMGVRLHAELKILQSLIFSMYPKGGGSTGGEKRFPIEGDGNDYVAVWTIGLS